MTETGHQNPRTDAGVATAEAGQVLLDGPDGTAVAMTPEAAEETGRSLIAAARQAREQQQASAAG